MGTGYDAAEYKEMLVDGAKLHFWALTNDPEFVDNIKNFKPNGVTLTYLRRLNVATAFVYSAAGLVGMDLSPQQQSEMKEYVKNLDEARGAENVHYCLPHHHYREDQHDLGDESCRSTSFAQLCNAAACQNFAVGGAPAAGAGGAGCGRRKK